MMKFLSKVSLFLCPMMAKEIDLLHSDLSENKWSAKTVGLAMGVAKLPLLSRIVMVRIAPIYPEGSEKKIAEGRSVFSLGWKLLVAVRIFRGSLVLRRMLDVFRIEKLKEAPDGKERH